MGLESEFNTLAVVCPRPPGAEQNSMLIETNTDLVRRLLVPLIGKDGLVRNEIHPKLHQACQEHHPRTPRTAEGVGRV